MRWYAPFILMMCLFATSTTVANETAAGLQTASQSAYGIFAKANALYKENKYEDALSLYEQLLSQGIADPVLYYNTGNAYAQLHRPGPAVLMYERALQLHPRDPDIQENLVEIAPAINRPRVFVLLRPLYRLKETFTLNELTLALDVLYLLFVAILLGVFLARRTAWHRILKRAARISAILLLLVACLFAVKLYGTLAVREAVVMQEASARSGPSTSFSDILKLPAGTKVRLVEKSEEGWARIRLRSGQSGYLPTSAFEII